MGSGGEATLPLGHVTKAPEDPRGQRSVSPSPRVPLLDYHPHDNQGVVFSLPFLYSKGSTGSAPFPSPFASTGWHSCHHKD